MSSINTNIAAMVALQTLNQTNKEMLQTQTRIATGLRVATAADNAAYWSIATTMRSDNQATSTVMDALGLGAATADIAVEALNKSIDVMRDIKSKLVAARQPGVDRSKIQTEINTLQSQLQSFADSAVFSGENWLKVDSTGPTSKTIVASFSRDSTGSIQIGTISVDISATGTMLVDSSGSGAGILDQPRAVTNGINGPNPYTILTIDISALTDSTADLTDLEDYIDGVDSAQGTMTDAATTLGAAKKRINLQQDFITALMDTIDLGISQLVDADMNKESTRLQALQVRQQLGVQALSIANQSAQQILQLFQG